MLVRFKKSIVREYFESLVIAVVLALFIRTFVVQAFKIPTGSMEPNVLIGDHQLVNKFAFGPTLWRTERAILPIRDIQRGDIVVFKFPKDPSRDLIKRAIGLPGDTVELRSKRVFINGKQLDEPYAYYLEEPPPMSQEMAAAGHARGGGDPRVQYGPVTVPAGHYFMMGDNRDNSEDSRYWGFLPKENVKGQPLVIYWSYDPDSPLSGPRWSRLLRPVR
jgi:signal peptidase I